MAVTTEIPWGDGTSDKIYLTRNASEGNQIVSVTSDANGGSVDRTKVVTFSASGTSPVSLTVTQAAKKIVQVTVSADLSSLDDVNSAYLSVDNLQRAFAGSSSGNYASFHWVQGAGAETKVYLNFDFSSIPANATILSVTGSKKVNMTGYQSSRWTSRGVCLVSGDTVKSTTYAMSSNAASWDETQAGTWTLEEIRKAQLLVYVTRSSSYVSTDYVLQVYGATMTVTYEYEE